MPAPTFDLPRAVVEPIEIRAHQLIEMGAEFRLELLPGLTIGARRRELVHLVEFPEDLVESILL